MRHMCCVEFQIALKENNITRNTSSGNYAAMAVFIIIIIISSVAI